MEQGNATHSGKLWENIQSRKENMNIPEPLRLGLNGQEWEFFRLNPMTTQHHEVCRCECCEGGSQLTHSTSHSTGLSLLYGIIIHIQREGPQMNHSCNISTSEVSFPSEMIISNISWGMRFDWIMGQGAHCLTK